MAKERLQRRLAAILAADVVGYSRLMGTNEASTLARIKALRVELIDPMISANGGRIVKLMGDGMLVEFASAVDAVTCALEIQRAMLQQNKAEPPDERIQLRIGINVGDIIIEGDDIFGDGVNLAARLEALAAPGGICVSRGAHEQVRGKLDVVFEDGGEQKLKNIAEPVRIYRIGPERNTVPGGTAPIKAPAVFGRAPKPSLAVLPFQNMSGDPGQEPFCDGLVEDIITTLSKLGGLSVIARNSTFVYKGRAVDVREVAKQLGVRYVLEGSVRKSGNRIRITAQLIDAEDGTHLWAERYDRAMDDIFAIQDEITLVLATEMQVKFTEGEQARLHYTTTTNVEAWTHWAQGLAHHRQAVDAHAQTLARQSWEKALALDPQSASLNAQLGFLHSLDARFAWWDDRQTAIKKALAYIDRAFQIDANSALAFTAFSLALLFQGQHDKAIAAARRAVDLAPGSADTAQLASYVFSGSGLPEEAVALCETAIKLNPNYPGAYLGTLGQAYRLTGRIEQALAAFQAYHARNPGFGLTDIVIIYQQSGKTQEAREALSELLKARPNLTIAAFLKTQFFHRDRAQIEADAAALRLAGLPEG